MSVCVSGGYVCVVCAHASTALYILFKASAYETKIKFFLIKSYLKEILK